MYEIGRVYIWQNLVQFTELNGQETTVTGGEVVRYDGSRRVVGQYTDTRLLDGRICCAEAGQLRPKNPPTGEQKIRSLFEPKPVMEVA